MMQFGRFRILAAGAALSAILAANPVWTATSADTLVDAWSLDEVISLDPAESFQTEPAEILGNEVVLLF